MIKKRLSESDIKNIPCYYELLKKSSNEVGIKHIIKLLKNKKIPNSFYDFSK